MFGTATARIMRALLWKKLKNDTWQAIDGNDNVAFRIVKRGDKSYYAEYTTPSLRLCSGPDAPFLRLGSYRTLADAKMISELHEKCEAVPVFIPGKIDGWVDKSGKIKLYAGESSLAWFKVSFLREFFLTLWSMMKGLINGKKK